VAESLFQEGKDLLQAKRYSEACPKLEESQRLDPATGTLIALAACHEALGKTASAWSKFTEAAAASAKEERADRVAFASERAAALAPRLSHVKVQVSSTTAALPGVELTCDGVAFRAALWGTWVPVDPGWHTIEASAPRHRAERLRFLVSEQRDAKLLSVPALKALEPGGLRAGAGEPHASQEKGRPQRTAGWAVGAVGAASLGVGTYFGVRAVRHHDQALERCSPTRCTDPEAVRLNDDAKVSANVANVGVGLGLLGIALGVILVLNAPDEPAPRVGRASNSLLVGPSGLAWRLSL